MSRHRASTCYARLGIILFVVLLGLANSQLAVSLTQASSNSGPNLAFAKGDVFAGVGAGKIKHFSATGTLLETLDTTSGSGETTGMCFDKAGNLYSTNFDAVSVSKFDNAGKLLLANFGSGFSKSPESCIVDSAQNVYVGQADGNHQILKFNSSGTPIANYSPATESRGTDWIDLAADQCTMYYTSEGTRVKRFNVCTNTQLTDLAAGLSAPCYALRIRSNGEVLVACESQVYRLSASGTVTQTFPASTYSDDSFFALNLDSDGTSFWTGGMRSGQVHKIDIGTGKQLLTFNSGILGKYLGGLAVFGELVQAQPTPVAPSGAPVTFQRDVTPGSLILNQGEFTVTLSLTGNSAGCGKEVTRKPLDIVLVIDRSSSMSDLLGVLGLSSGRTKLDSAKAAAKAFLSNVNPGTDKVAVVGFNEIADLVSPLDTNRQNLERAIDSLTPYDGTAIDQGVELARQELKSTRRRAGSNPVIVLLTDGQSDENAAMRAATAVKSEGIRLITIGLGNDVNQSPLQNMASQPTDYYFAPDANALADIYARIAESVKQFIAATNLTLKHTFDATPFQLVPGSMSPVTGTVVANTITWKIDSLGDTTQSLSYRLKPVSAGQFNVDLGDTITFTQCEKSPNTITEKSGLPVQVVTPTATPTRTPTRTRTITPTRAPTATPTPVVPPSPMQIACDYGYNSPLWTLCLWLPVLLILMWILWRLWQEFRKPREERNPCPLILWLLLPFLLILFYQILSVFANAACSGRESVYFWRISGDSSGIYVSSQDGARPAQSFNEVNQGGCIACHAVSSTSHRIAAVRGGGTGPVVVYDLNGKAVPIPSVIGSFVNWSPDGKKLAVSTDKRQIVIVDVDSGTVTPLTGASESGVAQVMPAWSSDGSTIAFVRSADPSGTFRLNMPTDIYTVPADGGVAEPLPGASGKGFNYYPAYSPDGRWLAFTHHISGTTTYSDPYAEIFLVPAGGGDPIRLAANDASDGKPLSQVSNSWPTWSRDGKMLAFNSKRNNGQYDIFVTQINDDGTSGSANPLASAADPQAFEHLPFWGEPPKVDPWAGILGLWPWLIPLLLIPLLYLLCRYLHRRPVEIIEEQIPVRPPPGRLPPVFLNPTWQVAPTLVIGVGGTGRWVLTHLKKILRDGGAGNLPDKVRFVLLDTSEKETNVFLDSTGKAQAVEFGGVYLEPNEMMLFRDNLENVVRALKANAQSEPALQVWFPVETYEKYPAGQMNLAEGTRARRPLARAGLVKKLVTETKHPQATAGMPPPEGTIPSEMLWEMLTEGTRRVMENQQVRVILVGSLAGGMSGTLFDLAHLARLAGKSVNPGGTVTVEGYFAVAGAFSQVPGNTAQRQVNTFATARELQRFQLSQGWPFAMRYRTGSAEWLDAKCDRQIFEDVFLFGAGGVPDAGKGKDNQPWATTFASMADVIAFRLDRGVGAGGESDYRKDIQKETVVRQQQRNMAYVGGAGSFTYRLPVYDIVEQIKTRWARQLLHEFIQGTAQEGVSRETLEDDVAKFFRGKFGCGNSPEGMRVLYTLGAGTSAFVERAEIKRIPEPSASPVAFQKYLQHALGLILNGEKANRTVPVGRVRYAVQFLERIAAVLKSAEKVAGETSGHARPEVQAGYERASKIAAQWHSTSNLALENLRRQRDLLEGRAAEPGKPAVIGAYQLIASLETQARERRKQMDRVAVREYFWWRAKDPTKPLNDPDNQMDLADEWYVRTADQHIQEYIERFYWEFTPEGAPKLSLIGFEGQNVALGPDSPDQFVHQVLRLGDHVVRDIWEQDRLSLTEVMRGRLMIESQDQAIQTATRMWLTATPHLLSRQEDKDKKWNAAFGLATKLREPARELVTVFQNLGSVKQRLASGLNLCPTSAVQFTDQYAVVLMRTLDRVGTVDIPEIEDARKVYEQSLKGPIAGVEGAELEVVSTAERNALGYEKRLPDPNVCHLPTRQFHPLVVMALEDEARARLYALAYAAGWVSVPEREGNVTLTLPGSGGQVLGKKKTGDTLSGEVMGLLWFCQEQSNQHQRFVDAVRLAITQPDDTPLDAWRAYYSTWHDWRGTPPMGKEPRELQDLGAFAAIVVYDTLKARLKR